MQINLKIITIILIFSSILFGQNENLVQGDWWNIPYPESFNADGIEDAMPFISVVGKSFVNEDGDTVVLRGVNISDPDKLVKNGRWSKAHFEVIKSWGSNVVRVPIHPIAWNMRGSKEYLKLLDQVIIWASELKLYLIFEWHSIGNLATEVFQHPMHYTSRQETYNFWRMIAFRYRGIPTVAFYELFNEPTRYGGQLGSFSWQEWKKINEDIIGIIFAHDKKVIPLVAGFNWAYDLSMVKKEPIGYKGIGYVSHPYPQKTGEPFEENWERDFGFVADTYPVIATEFGFMAADDPGAHIPVIADVEYGKKIITYFNKKGISWTAWCFDPDWPPQLISDWEYTPTEQGKFFKQVLSGKE